jgi:hypothetical protein
MRMKRLKKTRAILGESLKFIGISLVKKILSQVREAELIETLAAFDLRVEGEAGSAPAGSLWGVCFEAGPTITSV